MAPKPTLVQVLYLPEHASYAATAQYARQSLEHTSQQIMPFDFPQVTVTDGPESGMEYPMIIFSGAARGVVAHELGHQWFPMMVGSNETWYGWQDEGFAELIEVDANQAVGEEKDDFAQRSAAYQRVAGSENEAAMMWPSDFAGPNYVIQAYTKFPLALHALGGIVGDSAVRRAVSAYAQAWRYKHPSPWDFFMFMNRQLGKDLGWFWSSWWFTTETFDQGIARAEENDGTLQLTVVDHGGMPMPIIARIEYRSGQPETITQPASVWFSGVDTVTIPVPLHGRKVRRIILDPENRFQDVNRTDNTRTF
jgi:hypothetical protein